MDKRPIQLPDPLKHFAKDSAEVRLKALWICRLPLILGAAGGCIATIIGSILGAGRHLGWW